MWRPSCSSLRLQSIFFVDVVMSTVRWIQEQRGSLAGSRALCIFVSSSFSTWVQPYAGISVSSTHPVTGPLSAQTHSCSCVTHQSQEKLQQPPVCLSVPEGAGINQLMAFPAFNARPLKCSGGAEPQQFVLLGFLSLLTAGWSWTGTGEVCDV